MSEGTPVTPPPLTLLVDGEEWSARSLESILAANGYAVVRAQRGAQALDLARETRPDVYVIARTLPDVTGPELCVKLRSQEYVSASTPFVMTSATPWLRRERLEAFRAGAWEVIGLHVDAEAVLLRLNTFVGAKRDADRARESGMLDQQTGLYNMRGLLRRADELGSMAFRYRRSLASIALTPTSAKPREPALAPSLTNAQLQELVAELGTSIRKSDVVGRFSQTEFIVVAPDTGPEAAAVLTERLVGPDGPSRFHAGYCAVSDFFESSITPLEMLIRSTMALRHAQSAGLRAHAFGAP
jgi:PleD family two-component response regulator